MRKTKYFEAYLDDYKKINIYMSKNFFKGESAFFYLEDNEDNQFEIIIDKIHEDKHYICYVCSLKEEIPFGFAYTVINKQGRKTPLEFADIVKTKRFDEMFQYSLNDLGACYQKTQTSFKVWAPTASNVKLEVKKNNVLHTYEMERQEHGVYALIINGDLLCASYVFLVEVNGITNRALDPYAKMNDINSKRSIVVDVSSLRHVMLDSMDSYCDAIIYEASIRDMTQEKTYHSFIHTENKNQGYAYIRSLGITHIQLLPVLDFDGVNDKEPLNSYNWGYDGNAWMALENSYSRDIENPMQAIIDFNELIAACHEDNIRVNLDVVFNHVVEVSYSALNQIVPYYYFQLTKNHYFSNATMCGNDIDSTRYMCRKLIVDACVYLLETYDIDGVRFDLMGILDVDTINEVAIKCKSIKNDFMVYGEGWNMPSTLAESKRASMQNNASMSDIAHFSDVFRDTIKGSFSNNYLEEGYMLGNVRELHKTMNVLSGSVGEFGYQKIFNQITHVINYVECHDNMTSWDQIDLNDGNCFEKKLRQHKLLLASVLLAQGIPFLHSGQEFARTKNKIQDTYNLSDEINQIDYMLRDKNVELVEYTKQLIQIRKEINAFRLREVSEIYKRVHFEHIEHKVLIYKILLEDGELKVIFNPTDERYTYPLHREAQVIFYNGQVNDIYCNQLEIQELSVIIFYQKKNN